MAVANGLALALVLALGLALVPAGGADAAAWVAVAAESALATFLWIALDRMRPGGAPQLVIRVEGRAGRRAGGRGGVSPARLAPRGCGCRHRRVRRRRRRDAGRPGSTCSTRSASGGARTRSDDRRGRVSSCCGAPREHRRAAPVGAAARPIRDRGGHDQPRGPGDRGPRRPVDDGADETGLAAPRRASALSATHLVGDAYRDLETRSCAAPRSCTRPSSALVRRPAGAPAARVTASGSSRRCGRRSRSARRSAPRGRPRTAGVVLAETDLFLPDDRARPPLPPARRGAAERIEVVEPGSTSSALQPARARPGGASGRLARSARLGEGALRRDQSRWRRSGERPAPDRRAPGPSDDGCCATPTISGSPTGSRSGPSRTTRCRRCSRAASCVVLASLPIPTWEEQFGLVLAEALAAGAPIDRELLRARSRRCSTARVRRSSRRVTGSSWRGCSRPARSLGRPAQRETYPAEIVERYSTRAAAERLAAAYERVLAASWLGARRSRRKTLWRRQAAERPRNASLSGSVPAGSSDGDDVKGQRGLDAEELAAGAVEQPDDEFRVEDVVVDGAIRRLLARPLLEGLTRQSLRHARQVAELDELLRRASCRPRRSSVRSLPRGARGSSPARMWSKVFSRCGTTRTRWPSAPTIRFHSDERRSGFAMCSSVWDESTTS